MVTPSQLQDISESHWSAKKCCKKSLLGHILIATVVSNTGTLVLPSLSCWVVYSGGWQSNLKHGQGTMHYSSGNIYTGGWEADHKQGQGCMQWGEGEQYTGQWANGLQNGIGQHVWMQPAFPGASASTNHAFFLRHNRSAAIQVASCPVLAVRNSAYQLARALHVLIEH